MTFFGCVCFHVIDFVIISWQFCNRSLRYLIKENFMTLLLLLLFCMKCNDYLHFIENILLSKYLQNACSDNVFVKNPNLK
jgi:hypothetical protein